LPLVFGLYFLPFKKTCCVGLYAIRNVEIAYVGYGTW
jgi:hypothetical protein